MKWFFLVWNHHRFACLLTYTERTPREGEEAAATSLIRIIQEVHGGEVMPPDGGIVRPENVQVEPLFPKGELNTRLNVRVLGRTVGSNGLPSGHTDLDRRHPGLEKNFLEGILAVEVFPAPFRPEMVEDEGTKDVERLLGVRKSAGVVREEAGGIVLEFHGGLAKEQKGPGGREVAVNFPFVPDAFESLPRNLSHWAIK